ncbi:sonic hedgehog protein isoform X2 [Agrilus planipennis]|uniref:Protein hedgehog n=1 Tax=Agrilus planipennis TaxID=224129 RepID=A0A1W4WZ91_AGRPL|nr:sonic hedgehog protein isoform X2 [Agrilus planipennis]
MCRYDFVSKLKRCKEKLNTLAISVMNMWPGVKLRVTEGWDEEDHHTSDSLHYEGRAVDVTTSDRDRSKYGMLARLAVEAGFDWVYYESRAHIHCSVKSESSQAAKYGGCFSGDTSVITTNGRRRKLSELRIGESVLSWDSNTNRFVFSEVLMFLDWDPMQRRPFLQIKTVSGRTLTVTPSHLLLTTFSNDTRIVFAERLRVGDKLIVINEKNSLINEKIVSIRPIIKRGVFAPLTTTGTIIVNDVVASCYAVIDSQSIAHWAFLPFRLALNAKDGFARIWSLLAKPIEGWKDTSATVTKTTLPTPGIHWYATSLYNVAKYIVPSYLLYT